VGAHDGPSRPPARPRSGDPGRSYGRLEAFHAVLIGDGFTPRSPQRRLLFRRAINQAARDRASLVRSDLQASISLRIADNRGSVACGSSANSLVFSASTVAFSASII
jgi:hypothetical protein